MNSETQAMLDLLIKEIRNAEKRRLKEQEQEADGEAFDKVAQIIQTLKNKKTPKEVRNTLLVELLLASERLKEDQGIVNLLKAYEKQYEALVENLAKKFLSGDPENRESGETIKIIYDRFPENPKIERIAVFVFYFPPIPKKKYTP